MLTIMHLIDPPNNALELDQSMAHKNCSCDLNTRSVQANGFGSALGCVWARTWTAVVWRHRGIVVRGGNTRLGADEERDKKKQPCIHDRMTRGQRENDEIHTDSSLPYSFSCGSPLTKRVTDRQIVVRWVGQWKSGLMQSRKAEEAEVAGARSFPHSVIRRCRLFLHRLTAQTSTKHPHTSTDLSISLHDTSTHLAPVLSVRAPPPRRSESQATTHLLPPRAPYHRHRRHANANNRAKHPRADKQSATTC